jgi:hypothetical protein
MSDEVNPDAMSDAEFDAYMARLTAGQAATARENATNLQRVIDETDARDARDAADQVAAREVETQAVTTLTTAQAEADTAFDQTRAMLRDSYGVDVAAVDDGATGDAAGAVAGGIHEHEADVPEQARPLQHSVVEYRRSA